MAEALYIQAIARAALGMPVVATRRQGADTGDYFYDLEVRGRTWRLTCTADPRRWEVWWGDEATGMPPDLLGADERLVVALRQARRSLGA